MNRIDFTGRYWTIIAGIALWVADEIIWPTNPEDPDAIVQSSFPDIMSLAGGARRAIGRYCSRLKVGTGETTVIGRIKDLENLKQGEESLLARIRAQGNHQATWKENSRVLRQEMAKNQPIRDASPGDDAGRFLNAERNLLKNHGWTFDPQTNYWNPPLL